ncbi:hypothetical protein [Microbacterium cremeum]|uniref:hypothetical protein n=1 Tax=Microbacterium cremeum TaxID=2782169 RepID=UPI001888D648|nr:hypothetical protein [Microbacterium cremeum]
MTAALAAVTGTLLLVTATPDASRLPVSLVSGALALGATAALLLRRRMDVVGLVCAVAAVGCGITVLVADQDATSGLGAAAVVMGTAWMPGALIVVSVLGIGVVSPRRSLLAGGVAASLLFWSTTLVDLLLDGVWPGMVTTAAIVWVGAALAGGVALIHAWWTGEGSRRDAAGWLVVAQWSVLLAAVPGYADIGIPDALTALTATILPAAVILLAAVLLLTGLTREGAPVDVSLARVVFWVLLVLSLVVAFVAIVTAVAELAPVTPTTAGMFAVAGLALAIEPARRWVQRAVDQLAYGRSAEPQALLQALGRELSSSGEDVEAPEVDVLDRIARALRESLRLVAVEIVSGQPDGVAATAGPRVATTRALRIPLPGPDGPSGTLSVAGAAGGRVDRRTARVLRSIAGMLGLAVRLADVNREIDKARAQVLDVAVQERRLVRSELEDGVGAGVRSARQQVMRAEALADERPGDAGSLLEDAAQSLSDVTREVRDLARTLLPGSLDAGDAPGALAELARRFDRPHIAIDVAESAGEPSSSGMALAYHLIADAVLAARRDRAVDHIRVRVTAASGLTRIEMSIAGSGHSGERIGQRLMERARDAGASVRPVAWGPGAVAVDLVVPS